MGKNIKQYLLCIIVMIGSCACGKKEIVLPQEIGQSQGEKSSEDIEHKNQTPSYISVEEKLQEYVGNMPVEEKIGQLLMPAFRQSQYGDSVDRLTGSMEKVLEKYKVGGIILFKENIKTKDQVQLLIKDLQGKSNIPLWMGVDEEGGKVSRIASNPDMGFPPMPSAFEIGEADNKGEAYKVGKQLAQMLKELGFNMDFAPVADIWSNPSNEVIGTRSFGTDATQVSKMVVEVTKGLQDEGVVAVVKHFPGHGDTKEDSHVGRALVDYSLQELLQRELIPFQSSIDYGVEAVMVAHVELPQIDKGIPATLSSKIITDILKEKMEFKGLIITDALDMDAITKQFGKGEAAVQSFMAGTDILLMPDLEEAYSHLLKACEDKIITQERLDESVYKILYTKYKYGVISEGFFK